MRVNVMFLFILVAPCASAQQPGMLRVPAPRLSFLTITPDARSGGMGDAGVALSPDVNATYWNAAKLAMTDRDFGATVGYVPWLRSLTDDMFLANASAYTKIGKGQAIGAAVNYFKYQTGFVNTGLQTSSDISFSGMYAKQLGQNFSMGITLKYISSNFGTGVMNGEPVKPGRIMAADLSAFYRKQIRNTETGEDFNWSLGAVLSNVGNKVDYGGGGDGFIPTTLKIGGGVSYTANGRHKLNVIADAGKLLVPTPIPGQNTNGKPVIRGIIESFSDAPNGFKEEMQEIVVAMGAEYWYKNAFALRTGYYGENRNKGGQKYMTLGAGARFKRNYGIDASYLIPLIDGSPLARSFKVSLSVYFDGKKGKAS